MKLRHYISCQAVQRSPLQQFWKARKSWRHLRLVSLGSSPKPEIPAAAFVSSFRQHSKHGYLAMSEANREKSCDEGRSEERSDEWKIVSYVGRRSNAFAVASLKPSLRLTFFTFPTISIRDENGAEFFVAREASVAYVSRLPGSAA